MQFRMTYRILFLICFALFESSAQSDSLSERFLSVGITADRLFYEPRTEIENHFFQSGRYQWWQRYSQKLEPNGEYRGYVLLADPYHRGMERISFLLGSDCSHFVHRVYQILGADYPFLKTQGLLVLGEALYQEAHPEQSYRENFENLRPIDVPLTDWQLLFEQFEAVKIRQSRDYRVGDLIVYPRLSSFRGEYGHVVMVSSVAPFEVIQSENRKGVTQGSMRRIPERAMVLRWRGPLKPLPSYDLSRLLEERYAPDPRFCERALGNNEE